MPPLFSLTRRFAQLIGMDVLVADFYLGPIGSSSLVHLSLQAVIPICVPDYIHSDGISEQTSNVWKKYMLCIIMEGFYSFLAFLGSRL